MAPLTWRNVDAPSFAASNDLLKYAGQAFNAGFDTLDQSLGDFQGALTTAQSNALMTEALKYQDPAEFAAALKSGTMLSGVDTRNLNGAALDFLNNRVGDLYGDRQAAANLTGTDLINSTRAFDLSTAQADRARLEEMRTLQPAAYDLIVNARTLASSGRPEDLARAREMINNNTTLFTNAGVDINSMLGLVSGNEAAFQTGLGNNQNVRLAADWWKAKGVGDNSDTLVAAAIQGSANADDAIRAIASSGVDPAIKRQAIADLTANAGSYYPAKLDPMASLLNDLTGAYSAEQLGAPAGLGNNESGNNFGAVNSDTGASGRLQFTADRLADAKKAGVIPQGMTLEQFRADPTAQQATEAWHWGDINKFITDNDLDQYIGKTVGGVTITADGMRSMAHLGGKEGMKKFLETGGTYNPADSNGTKISDYGSNFNGGGSAPVAAPTPVDTSLPIPGTFSPDGNPVSNPVPALPGTPDTQLVTDIIQRSALSDNMLSNDLQGVDFGLASERFKDMTRGQIVDALKKGSLSDVPTEALTAAVDQAVAMGMSPAMAGILVENNLESRNLGGLPIVGWFAGDQYGGPTSGQTAPRIDMEGVKADYDAYVNKRASGGQDISPAVARLKAAFNNQNVPVNARTLNMAAAAAKSKYDQVVQAAAQGKNVNIEAAQLEYEASMAAINGLLDAMGTAGVAGSTIDQYSRVVN